MNRCSRASSGSRTAGSSSTTRHRSASSPLRSTSTATARRTTSPPTPATRTMSRSSSTAPPSGHRGRCSGAAPPGRARTVDPSLGTCLIRVQEHTSPGSYQHPYVMLLWGVMTMRDTEDSASVWDVAGSSFARWRAGDPSALDELVHAMSPILWHVVRATGLSKEQSEDVVQTAWLALVRNAETVGDPQAVARWLCTTARREAWRVSKTAGRSTPVEDDTLEWRLPSQPSPESEVVLGD